MLVEIRQAAPADTEIVSAILVEAADWLERRGTPMWRANELGADRIAHDVHDGLFFLGTSAGETVGTVKFQLTDPLFWPDVPQGDSAFVHRLAIRRHFAGGAASSALLAWALERAQSLDRSFLRLDCEASRARLRAVYERFGFRHHSDRQVGPYLVARYELGVGASRQG